MLHNEHLTTEQLSTYLDHQLPTQELSSCETHLATCQRCQEELSGLKQIAALLHALPPAPLPRSFLLPVDVLSTPQQDQAFSSHTTTPPTMLRKTRRSTLRTTVRVLSSLAALIGIFFLASAILPMLSLPLNEGPASTASQENASVPSATDATTATPPHQNDDPEVYQIPSDEKNQPAASDNQSGFAFLSTIDLNQPEVRLGFGILLLLAGIIGLMAFRQQSQVRQQRE